MPWPISADLLLSHILSGPATHSHGTGARKYVESWPLGLLLVAVGYCFRYFWGPGKAPHDSWGVGGEEARQIAQPLNTKVFALHVFVLPLAIMKGVCTEKGRPLTTVAAL